jgi:hypothetical protein
MLSFVYYIQMSLVQSDNIKLLLLYVQIYVSSLFTNNIWESRVVFFREKKTVCR